MEFRVKGVILISALDKQRSLARYHHPAVSLGSFFCPDGFLVGDFQAISGLCNIRIYSLPVDV